MHDRALECSDESLRDSAEASGRCVRPHHGSVSGPATPPGGGFAAFMSMRLSRDDAVKDDAKSEERSHAVLVRSFERAYVARERWLGPERAVTDAQIADAADAAALESRVASSRGPLDASAFVGSGARSTASRRASGRRSIPRRARSAPSAGSRSRARRSSRR